MQKLTIPHLKGLIVDIYSLEGQGRSTIKDRPDSLNVKKQTFQEKWVWQVREAATPLSFYKFIVHNHKILWVFVPFVVFEKIKHKVGICKSLRFYLIKLRKFKTFNFELNFLKKSKW